MIKINVKDSKTQGLIRAVEIDMFVVAVDGPEPSIDLFVGSEQAFFGGAVTAAEMVDAVVVEPVVTEPEYEATGEFTIQQLLDAKWSYDQMVTAGHAKLITPAVEPTPEPVATAPAAPVPEVAAEPRPVVMTAKAAGATRQQFIDTGWTDDQLVEHGYMEAPVVKADPIPSTPAPAAAGATPAPDGWPRQHEGEWIDAAGEVWSEAKHSKSASSDVPPVTAAGVFKKRRGAKKAAATPTVPAVTAAPVAPGPDIAPAAPAAGAPPAPTAAATDAAVVGDDAELASIIKNWPPKEA
jgi:hypothetical protein